MNVLYSLVMFTALLSASFLFVPCESLAKGNITEPVEVEVYMLTTENSTGLGESVGKIIFTETAEGLLIKPMLKGLPSGEHGFHVHENPMLGPKMKDGKLVAGLEAGGHFDPEKTGKHLGPYNPNGHLGDLPILYVGEDGTTPYAVLAPRLKLEDILNRSIMIHLMGDNYSDHPSPLGGGGSRLAGGIVKK